MNLVSNTKTLIFDDQYDEIVNLRMALDKLRVQNLYIKFDEVTTLSEEEKFTNVRFIFVDILVGSGRTGNVKGDISPIITSIVEHISKKNGAFILVIWSNHNTELSKELIQELRDIEKYNFFEVTSIEKSEYTKEGSSIDSLIEKIKQELKDNTEFFNLLRIWEKDIHTATSETLNIFLDDLTNKEKIHSMLKNAVIASAGTKQKTDEISKRKNLWNTLNMVLQDNVEVLLESNKIPSNAIEILNSLDNDSTIFTNEIINKKILFSVTNDIDSKMFPGNIFSFESFPKVNCCDGFKERIFSKKSDSELVEEVVNSDELNKSISNRKEEENLTRKGANALRNEIISSFIPIVLEFTPYCDFSQKGYKKTRLILGYILPMEHRKFLLQNSKFTYTTPNFELEDDIKNITQGKYCIVLNIKHLFALDPASLENLDLLFRARKELLNDIQHDIASHISRVGVTSLL